MEQYKGIGIILHLLSGIRAKQMKNTTISFVMSIEYQTQNNTNNYVIPLALVLCYTLVLFLFMYQIDPTTMKFSTKKG